MAVSGGALSASHPDRVAAMTKKWDAWFHDVMEEYRGARASNVAPRREK